MRESVKQTALPVLSLFTSVGTLLCCALPALLVTLGAGAALAGFVSAAPWLVELSKHKLVLFAVAGGLLVAAGVLRYRARHAPCPVDPLEAKVCMRLRGVSTWVYRGAVVIYAIGFFFAFVAARLVASFG
jgi:uncharacterized membrane protein (UPF0136 family)